MNIVRKVMRNMEAVVIAAVATTFVTAVATASAPVPRKQAQSAVAVDNVTTIVVTGKRLTAAQKASFKN